MNHFMKEMFGMSNQQEAIDVFCRFPSVSPDEQCQAPLLKTMADRNRHKGTSNDVPKQLEATVTTQSG